MKLKRITALCLVLLLLVCVLPSPARAAALIDYGKVGAFSWVLDEYGTLILSGSGYFSSPSDIPWAKHRQLIEKLVLSEGITGLDPQFLGDLPQLWDISIPSTLDSLSPETFANCDSLSSLYVDYGNPKYTAGNNVLFSKDMTTLIFYPHGLTGAYTVPNGVTTIGADAFCNSKKLTGVTLSSTITRVLDRAFSGCSSLSSVSFSGKLARLGLRAFDGCTALTAVTLPNSLKEIGAGAFQNSGLKSVTIPAGTTMIGEYAFSVCEALTSIKVDSKNANYSSDGIALFNKDQTALLQYPGGRSGSYSMPDTVQSFSTHAFWYNDALTELTLSDALVTIPDCAFAGCSGLSTLQIPTMVQRMGRDIFTPDAAPSTVYFLGSAPAIPNGAPFGSQDPVTMTVYRPRNDDTWTAASEKAFGGKISWKYRQNVSPFADVPSYAWYLDPVIWAVNNGITNGVSDSKFGPASICNRAQVVTFLWRAAGCPEYSSMKNPFVDVARGSFYEKAVLWAVRKGITNGTDATHFSPDAPCNRATVVTFLYRAAGAPSVSSVKNPFVDVPSGQWFTSPVLWAVKYGITTGTDATHFSPVASCNRAQIVTFLYRASN